MLPGTTCSSECSSDQQAELGTASYQCLRRVLVLVVPLLLAKIGISKQIDNEDQIKEESTANNLHCSVITFRRSDNTLTFGDQFIYFLLNIGPFCIASGTTKMKSEALEIGRDSKS